MAGGMSAEEARATALAQCRRHGDGGRRVVATFENRCAALAAGISTFGDFWAVASNKKPAQQQALAKCQAAHASGCHLVDSGRDPYR